jgi:hypothetical protein
MLKSIIQLVVKQSLGDEWAVYAMSEGGGERINRLQYLLFSFGSNREEAISKGTAIADILNLPIKVEYADSLKKGNKKKEDKKEPTIVRGNKLGTRESCQKMLSEGKSDEEIKAVLTQMYIGAGRIESKAKQLAYGVLYDEKKRLKSDNTNPQKQTMNPWIQPMLDHQEGKKEVE